MDKTNKFVYGFVTGLVLFLFLMPVLIYKIADKYHQKEVKQITLLEGVIQTTSDDSSNDFGMLGVSGSMTTGMLFDDSSPKIYLKVKGEKSLVEIKITHSEAKKLLNSKELIIKIKKISFFYKGKEKRHFYEIAD